MLEGNNFSDLVAYFKNISEKHVDLKGFYRFELDEILTSLRDVQTPCLIMEGYKFNFIDNKSDNILKSRGGAFVLIDHIDDIGDFDSIHTCWDNLEIIADDILAKIKADKRDPLTPVKHLDFESVDGQLVASELNSYYGIRITFNILCKFDSEIDESRWLP
ncbi:MAG: hypothetical protein ACOYMF_09805 [Bacteroidales bacterium]